MALLVCTTGCEAMVPYHRYSAEYEGEHTAVVLDTVDAEHATPIDVVLPRDGIHASFLRDPLGFERRLETLVGRVAAVSSRPPSSWVAKTAGVFYAAPPRVLDTSMRGKRGELVELRPGVRGFRIERWLHDDCVTTIEYSLEFTDSAFRVTLDRISMPYSRAKVADKSWRNWWARIPCVYGFWFDIEAIFGTSYGDGAVDVQVDLEITSSSTNSDGDHQWTPIAVLGWTVLDVELGGATRRVGQSSGWLPLVPPSVLDANRDEHRYGQGRFTLNALVTEQDDFGPKYVEERESIGDFVNDVMGVLTNLGLPVL
jgi:hypothetical protein